MLIKNLLYMKRKMEIIKTKGRTKVYEVPEYVFENKWRDIERQ